MNIQKKLQAIYNLLKNNINKEIKVTERGYAGHYICSSHCKFRRNTLIEFGDKRIVVSTVGDYSPCLPKGLEKSNIYNDIGAGGRKYETMAFWAEYKKPYWEADVSKQIDFESEWAIYELEYETDFKADEMHDNVVKEISKLLSNNLLKEEI